MVTLLPAVQAVGSRVFLRFLTGLSAVIRAASAQLVSERVEHMRNMIVELFARQRRSGGQLRVTFNGVAPALQNHRLPFCEVQGQRRELLVKLISPIHGSVRCSRSINGWQVTRR